MWRSVNTLALLAFLTLAACADFVPWGPVCTRPDGFSCIPTTFTGFSNLPANGDVILYGEGVGANTRPGAAAGTLQVRTVSGQRASHLHVTTKANTVTGIFAYFPTTGNNFLIQGVHFDTAFGNDTAVDLGNVILYSAELGFGDAFIADMNELKFEHHTFAAWIDSLGRTSSKASVGAASFGNRTRFSTLPAKGTANYAGATAGFYDDPTGQPHLTTSTAAISTDFSSFTITSFGTQITNMNTAVTSSASNLDFAGTGKVSGTKFSGTIAGIGIAGQTSGFFYGPRAVEAGGTFSAVGGGSTYIGGYGGN